MKNYYSWNKNYFNLKQRIDIEELDDDGGDDGGDDLDEFDVVAECGQVYNDWKILLESKKK